MVMKRTKTPWMDANEFGRSIPNGLGLCLLVKDVEASVGFASHVLGAESIYDDEDFAFIREPVSGASWILHADHAYSDHRLSGLVRSVQGRGMGAEFRLYGLDPDAAEARAREWGYTILDGSTDKPHGLREVFIFDPDWYCWVPSVPLKAE
jgi:catechol 2,3-dioxygenase-like lactoylglutathione lyase family enzyme